MDIPSKPMADTTFIFLYSISKFLRSLSVGSGDAATDYNAVLPHAVAAMLRKIPKAGRMKKEGALSLSLPLPPSPYYGNAYDDTLPMLPSSIYGRRGKNAFLGFSLTHYPHFSRLILGLLWEYIKLSTYVNVAFFSFTFLP